MDWKRHDDHSSSSSNSGISMGSGCKISMLWNWNTVDACFISTQWHIRTVGQYAGTVISIFLVALLVEGVRRLARQYDRRIARAGYAKMKDDTVPFRPTVTQQAIRSLLYGVQFSAGYMLMLLAMYYNGGIIFAIWTGAIVGHFLTAWDTVGEHEASGRDCCT